VAPAGLVARRWTGVGAADMLWANSDTRVLEMLEKLYAARDWNFFPQIDRVYMNDRARMELGWTPKYDFAYALKCLRSDQDFRSSLARDVGSKGYHDRSFTEGPYPVA